jgi:hypothetical protein
VIVKRKANHFNGRNTLKKHVSCPHVIYGAWWVPVFFGERFGKMPKYTFFNFFYLFIIKLFSCEKISNISPKNILATIGLSF